MGLSLQLTKVLMNRGIVRERFVLPAHECVIQMSRICAASAHVILSRRKCLNGVEAIIFVFDF